jgi:dihydroxyacetone kinase
MTNPMENREAQAKRLDEVVTELEKAIAHAKTAAAHFRSAEVPRIGGALANF